MGEQADKALRLIGLARRADRLVMGRTAVEEALKNGRAHLILFAADAPEKLREQMAVLAGGRPVKTLTKQKNTLGGILGRDTLAVVAVCDREMAVAIEGLLD